MKMLEGMRDGHSRHRVRLPSLEAGHGRALGHVPEKLA